MSWAQSHFLVQFFVTISVEFLFSLRNCWTKTISFAVFLSVVLLTPPLFELLLLFLCFFFSETLWQKHLLKQGGCCFNILLANQKAKMDCHYLLMPLWNHLIKLIFTGPKYSLTFWPLGCMWCPLLAVMWPAFWTDFKFSMCQVIGYWNSVANKQEVFLTCSINYHNVFIVSVLLKWTVKYIL